MSEAHRRSVILTVLTMLVILLGPAALAAPVEYWQKRSATKTSGSTYPSTWTKIVDPLPVPAPNALNVATRSCLDVNWFPNQCSGWGQMWASR